MPAERSETLSRNRPGAFMAAGYLTLFFALPSGAAGWAAAWGIDAWFGLGSSRPIWFLPLWCGGVFLLSVLNSRRIARGGASRPERERPEAEDSFRRAA